MNQILAPRRRTLETATYGVLEDEEVIQIYRVQQFFNNLLNQIMASVSVPSHHPGMFICAAVMAYIVIKFHTVIQEGVFGYPGVRKFNAFIGSAVSGNKHAHFSQPEAVKPPSVDIRLIQSSQWVRAHSSISIMESCELCKLY